MILSKYVNIKISNNQIKYYIKKGYNIKGGNEFYFSNIFKLVNYIYL